MQFIIHAGDELPIYRQIMRQITEGVAAGKLEPGAKLPSHRELAEDLAVAPLTVKKAYDELELIGFIETQRGRGTFVRSRLPRMKPAVQREQIQAAARKLLSVAYLAGLDFEDIVVILKKTADEWTHDRIVRISER